MSWHGSAPSRRLGPHRQVWHRTAMGTKSKAGAAWELKQHYLLNFPLNFPCSFSPNLFTSTWSPTMAQKYFEVFDMSAHFASEDGKDVFLTFQHEIQTKF